MSQMTPFDHRANLVQHLLAMPPEHIKILGHHLPEMSKIVQGLDLIISGKSLPDITSDDQTGYEQYVGIINDHLRKAHDKHAAAKLLQLRARIGDAVLNAIDHAREMEENFISFSFPRRIGATTEIVLIATFLEQRTPTKCAIITDSKADSQYISDMMERFGLHNSCTLDHIFTKSALRMQGVGSKPEYDVMFLNNVEFERGDPKMPSHIIRAESQSRARLVVSLNTTEG